MPGESSTQHVTNRDQDTFGGEIAAVATPATRIALAYLVSTFVVGTAVGTYLYYNPELFGEQGYARLAGLVVLALTAVGVVRLAIKYVVLLRTKYIVTEDSVRREYALAYREEARELPLHMIRGVETSKSRLQAMLGYATISFLAVGSNRGIGYVEFDNTSDPEALQSAVLELLERQRENAVDDGDLQRAAPAANEDAVTVTASENDGGGRAPTQAASAEPAAGAGSGDEADAASGADGDAGRRGDSPDDGDAQSVFGDEDPLGDADDDPRRPVSEADDSPTGSSK